MPYKTPLQKPKRRETTFAHTVKLCWFYVKFEDIHNETSLRRFCNEFEEIVVKGGIWELVVSEYNIDCDLYKPDGTIHKPRYDKLFAKDGWIKKYEWNEQYPIFKADMLMSSDETERERYIRNKRKANNEDYDSLERCYQFKEKVKSVYENKANEETITLIDGRLRERNGFDKEASEDKQERIPIPDNPEQESQHIRDLWKTKAWKEVIPR